MEKNAIYFEVLIIMKRQQLLNRVSLLPWIMRDDLFFVIQFEVR